LEGKNSLKKIISGGQTGVDQAALQAAIDCHIEHGGWCPPGRTCEDGVIPDRFNLDETPVERDSSAPSIPRSQRTIWNVRDADGVLIFSDSQSDKGTRLAIDTAIELKKPYLVLNSSGNLAVDQIWGWISENSISILSVGGPSERISPGIYGRVHSLLMKILGETKS